MLFFYMFSASKHQLEDNMQVHPEITAPRIPGQQVFWRIETKTDWKMTVHCRACNNQTPLERIMKKPTPVPGYALALNELVCPGCLTSLGSVDMEKQYGLLFDSALFLP
jgi:hypothetical protein